MLQEKKNSLFETSASLNKKRKQEEVEFLQNFEFFPSHILLLYGIFVHDYSVKNKRGPFSWYILARYLPHVSIFVLVYLQDGLRPQHVVYL